MKLAVFQIRCYSLSLLGHILIQTIITCSYSHFSRSLTLTGPITILMVLISSSWPTPGCPYWLYPNFSTNQFHYWLTAEYSHFCSLVYSRQDTTHIPFSALSQFRCHSLPFTVLISGQSVGFPLSAHSVPPSKGPSWFITFQLSFMAHLQHVSAWTCGVTLLCDKGCKFSHGSESQTKKISAWAENDTTACRRKFNVRLV